MAMSKQVTVPLIIASAMLMQQIDATALATSLPTIAREFGEPPLYLHLTITVYLLSSAAFLPISGWAADRFGARLIFRLAIAIFTISSAFCGLANDLLGLVLPRVVQGMAGAMMVPVGRLILVRTVSKAELLKAFALMSMPALVGPVIGPVFGGFITTFLSWRWIFWINLPIGAVGIVLATLFIDDVHAEEKRRFDLPGALLSGLGLSALLFGIDGTVTGSVSLPIAIGCVAAGALALGLYARHSRRTEHAIIDLKLLRAPTFRASVAGGSLFRMAMGAIPFVLPLLFQEGFGYSSFASGTMTAMSAVGAFGMRMISVRLLRHFGFRTLLIGNGLFVVVTFALYALIQPGLAVPVILGILLLGGVSRSLEIITLNTLAFADLEDRQMSHATSFSTMMQRLSQTMGVAMGATVLSLAGATGQHIHAQSFSVAFIVIAGVSSLSLLSFFRLRPDAGASLSGRASSGEA